MKKKNQVLWDLARLGLIFDDFSSFCDDWNDEKLSNTSPRQDQHWARYYKLGGNRMISRSLN